FDKAAKILGLEYPGGPAIEKMAKKGHAKAYKFRCDCGSGLDFSFSGIKTAVLYKVRELEKLYGRLKNETVSDICASFQESVVNDLTAKSVKAVKSTGSKILAVGGGVAFNGYLRESLESAAQKNGFKLFIAPRPYCLDNAAMVASLGARLFKTGINNRLLKLDPMAG
ncbi:MAG TPA: tRNA (adenosine(37)-N6)-threonylcarbamoyltransferase complex transferase subunit TsaD, partial [Candidatus Omnitrophota bacterium]|nr:tRNA (adenosine(37)-N6)-threonylcarbamoyltransferase complex transferase subunit TsaD [Candidatus Omnitrophota bacterium]